MNNVSNENINKLKFCELEDKEFGEFALKHPQNNFFQSLYMKQLLLTQNREVYLVGLKDDKKIVCASLITSSGTFMGKKTYEALKGFLIDYQDFKLVEKFTNELKKFIKEKNGFRLTIDPYIPHIQRDIDGNVVEGGIDNSNVIEELKKIGYQELKNSAQVKWTFVLDTNKSFDEVLANMKPNTRNAINKTLNKYKLVVEELKYDDLAVFKKITEDTCERRGFGDRSLKYYQDMYNIFKDDLKVLVCKLDIDLYINALEEEKAIFNDKIINLSDSNSNMKKKEVMKKDIINIDGRIEEANKLKEEKGNTIILSGAMFVLYGSEVIYLFSGSYDEYMKYCGQYRLQYEMIKYACDHNYRRYNFYGIMDLFDKNGKDYGVYEFKRGFNGYVEELLGAYEIKIDNTYNIYKLLKKIFKK